MRVSRDADSDPVRIDLLRPRKGCHRQLGLRQRQRRDIGIAAHLGDGAGRVGSRLPRLVLASGGVPGQHMRHLVAQHRGQFGGVAGQRNQAPRYIKLTVGEREGVHRAGIEDGDLVGLVGPLGSRHQPIDGLADQRFQLRVVIGAAIGRQDALVFLFGGGALDERTFGLGGGAWRRACGLKTVDIAATRKQKTGAQQDGRSP